MSRLILNQQLWAAACNNDVAMVEAAMVAGADPDFRDSPADPTTEDACFSTHSILHEAAYRGHGGVVDLLLVHGAEQCKDGTYGLTPLHMACIKGHVEVCRLLLPKAKINARCDTGDTALMTALLGENPYPLTAPPLEKKVADTKRMIELVDLLLDAGGDPNANNDPGETPIWNALRYQQPVVMAHLIERGADIHHTTVFRTTLLAEAGEALARADSWGEIPHRRREAGEMRKRVHGCLTLLHEKGLCWEDIPAADLLNHFPSEGVYHQLRALWKSLEANPAANNARAISI